jgi:uncharacterized protein (DUF1015 family)
MGPLQRRILRARHPYNAVWLEVPEGESDHTLKVNRYTRARDAFRRWRRERSLVSEPASSFYLLRQHVRYNGSEHSRLALLAVVRLEEYEKGVILPHEHTIPWPIRDRLSLLRACHANFSPLMVLYRDTKGTVAGILRAQTQSGPVLRVRDTEDNLCEMWGISDSGVAGEIQAALDGRALYMADGHHRYEAALAYRDEMREALGDSYTGREAFNYVFMALISCEDPGMLVLPFHRVLGGLSTDQMEKVWDRVDEFFDTSPFDVPMNSIPGAIVERVVQRGAGTPAIGAIAPDGGTRLLTLRENVDIASMGELAAFDSWLLQEKVLRPALGDAFPGHTTYEYDEQEVLWKIRSGAGQIAFFVRPVTMDLFESVVSRGIRLPPKSTNFYPKLPTGLVFNSLEGEV